MLKSDYKENLPSNQQADNTMEILVMDNNILLINLLGKSLIQDGIKITSVADVENAVKILKERIFDVVLFDGPNDDYSKEAILELFDKNGFLQDQRIVLFSGATQSSFIEKWKAKGLYSYIEKPTSTQKILEFLQVVKNESRPKKILNSQMTQEQEMLEGNIETSMIVEDEATPEQLAKVEELTKQIDELEKNYNSKVSKSVSKQDETSMIVEDEATPEQLAKVEELTKQIDELESQPPESTSSEKIVQESESVSKQDETSMIVEDEATPEQLAKVEELTKQIDELEKNYNSKVSKNIKQHHTENHSDTPKKQFPQTTFETDSNSEFKKILSRLSSIKNQFLYNTSNVSSVSQIQITEDELFNLKKEISKVRRKVYRTRPKQKNTKSTSSQKKKDKKRHTSKKKRK
ncbi:MAG: hypothetical protein OEX98_00810 [Nitrosopumilus sp.]|nr:hypothetical protein [Nitrosopumilus sp.]